ncbi:unnamed protein product [Timema podura]|uniref:Uncharacterized protein n=1 Tax=Timema podura TaxID=61482 RepID=A0ABN7NN24_TIMPD|nr:unnamed protein product [Timema podura]
MSLESQTDVEREFAVYLEGGTGKVDTNIYNGQTHSVFYNEKNTVHTIHCRQCTMPLEENQSGTAQSPNLVCTSLANMVRRRQTIKFLLSGHWQWELANEFSQQLIYSLPLEFGAWDFSLGLLLHCDLLWHLTFLKVPCVSLGWMIWGLVDGASDDVVISQWGHLSGGVTVLFADHVQYRLLPVKKDVFQTRHVAVHNKQI